LGGSALEFCGKNTNSKYQITNKPQIPIFNHQKLSRKAIVLNFGIGIFLIFGI
jgi:hypothetical protein